MSCSAPSRAAELRRSERSRPAAVCRFALWLFSGSRRCLRIFTRLVFALRQFVWTAGPILRFEKHPGHAAKATFTLQCPGVAAFAANAPLVWVCGHAARNKGPRLTACRPGRVGRPFRAIPMLPCDDTTSKIIQRYSPATPEGSERTAEARLPRTRARSSQGPYLWFMRCMGRAAAVRVGAEPTRPQRSLSASMPIFSRTLRTCCQ